MLWLRWRWQALRGTALQLQLLVDTSWLLAGAVLYQAEAWQGKKIALSLDGLHCNNSATVCINNPCQEMGKQCQSPPHHTRLYPSGLC